MPLTNKQQKKLLCVYSRLIRYSEKTLRAYLPLETAQRLMADTLEEGAGVIARLPDSGGRRNLHTPIIQIAGLMISFYLAAKRAGLSPEEAVFIMRAVCKQVVEKVPRPVGRLIGRFAFAPIGRGMFLKQAVLSQKRQYPGDFVFQAEIKKDPDGITITNVFSECAVHKLFEQEGVPELKPYCNFFDPLYSVRFGMGVDANHTFAQYRDACRLEFNNQRATHTPDNIKVMIERAEKRLKQHIK